MKTRHKALKSKVGVCTVGLALALAFASIAWACTVFYGKMIVTASSTGTPIGSGTPGGSASAVGAGTNMTLCSGTVSQGAYLAAVGGTFSVEVEPAACSGTSYQLPGGTYDVTYFPNYPAFNTGNDCMSPRVPGGMGVIVGSLSVGSDGKGAGGPYGLPGNVTNTGGRAAICVTRQQLPTQLAVGMGVPVYVI